MNLGTLYIVSTPIGNLKDITLRALEILKEVDVIAAEDTRHSLILLNHYEIKNKHLISLHEHNEGEKLKSVLKFLQEGKSLALISDAGTPLISDPGYFLVSELQKLAVKIVPIPGPCALITALSVSGLDTTSFKFVGFLPLVKKERQTILENLQKETSTIIFYEAPHRILQLLKELIASFGENKKCVIARELTKTFEELKTGTLQEMQNFFENKEKILGELVVLLEGNLVERPQDFFPEDKIKKILFENLSTKDAAKLMSKITGKKPNFYYQEAINKKSI